MCDHDEKVIGRIIIDGKITLTSPAIIGSGESEFSDIEVIKNSVGKPFIPATSLIGVLKSNININKIDEDSNDKIEENYNYLFGSDADNSQKKDSYQSALICYDLISDNAKIVIRDGVKINPETGTAEDQCKFNYEVIEPGAEFTFKWEVVLREKFNKDIFRLFIATMKNEMASGNISIGAMTNKGFGRFSLKAFDYRELYFEQPEHALAWLKNDYSSIKTDLPDEAYAIKRRSFSIEAEFLINSSLIVRSYPSDIKSPDAVHIKSNMQYVLPGTSIMGAIRHRALKILKTLNKKEPDEIMNGLFGIVKVGGNGNSYENKSKGRVKVAEAIIKKENVSSELQTRIKIDRFTGGTIDGALFDSMPLWQKEDSDTIKICMTINDFNPWEAGLLLHVLKDLWTGDLAIGGEKSIGRGTLVGRRATITIVNDSPVQVIELKTAENGSIIFENDEARGKMEGYANKLLEFNHE